MKYYFFIAGILLLTFSCNPGKEKSLPTYVVVNKNFENSLLINGAVEPVNTAIAACPPDMEGVVNNLIEDGTLVEEGDVLCVIEVPELATVFEEVNSYLDDRKAHLEKVKASLDLQYAILEAQVQNNEAETQIALLDSATLQFTSPNQRKINQLELRKVEIEKQKLKKKLDALAIINQTEIRGVEFEIQRLSNRVQTIKDHIESLTLKSPKKGLAIRSKYRRTGEKIQNGDMVWHLMPIVTIPDMNAMKVKIQATESDYKQININDSVTFTFDAMPGNWATGKITTKSPVGQQYKEGSKVKFFDIEMSVDSFLKIPEPGLTANCKIILRQVKDTLVVPQVAVNEVDSMKVVYVKNPQGYEIRQVETGLYSHKEIIITSGLRRGEEIALIKPGQDQIEKIVRLPLPEKKEEETVLNDTINQETENIVQSTKIVE